MQQPAPTLICPQCDRVNPVGSPACRSCSTPLTVSLAVGGPATQEVAQQLAGLLAGGNPHLAQRLENRLVAGRGILIRELSMAQAEWCLEQARALGATLEIRQLKLLAAPPPAEEKPRWVERPVTGVVMLLLVILVVSAGLLLYRVATRMPGDAGMSWRSATIAPGRIATQVQNPPADRPGLPERSLALSDALVEKVKKAVVHIQARANLGSGFFVSRDGLVVTNYHVIQDERPIEVTVGSQVVTAEVVRMAPSWDLALLRVPVTAPEVLPLADGALAAQTTPVMTIGSAEGLAQSVRTGTVAYVGRSVDAISLLELDLPVAHGLSGAPVVDYRGQVVGIVRATQVDSHATSYAILSNYLFDGADALLRGFAPVFPLSDAFLKRTLRSLVDVGPVILERHALSSSQTFVTENRTLVAIVEDSSLPETDGQPVDVEIYVRAGDGNVLLKRFARAETANGAAANASNARAALFTTLELDQKTWNSLVAATGVQVEVYVPVWQFRRLLPMRL